MLDVHAVTSGGSLTTLAAITKIAAGNDGATAAGAPIANNATLVSWGGLTTVADVIEEMQLLSQDQLDPVNGTDFKPGATNSLLVYFFEFDNLPFKQGNRKISMAQKTAAANNIGFTVDAYPEEGKNPAVASSYAGAASASVSATFTFSALTAITWGTKAWAPTSPPPLGKYALKGFNIDGLTASGALVRFSHANFQGKKPGFFAIDTTSAALSNSNTPKDSLLLYQGYQFVRLSEIFKQSYCPVFEITAQGTGLTAEVLDIAGDTPDLTIYLEKVGDLGT